MTNNLFNISVASTIITGYYQKLINLALTYCEDSSEFKDTIEKLKECVRVEHDFYLALDDNDINEYFKHIKNKTSFSNKIDGRIYMRISNIKKIYEGNPVIDGDKLLSSIISSKITIDVLKNVEQKIIEINNTDTMDEEDKAFLSLYSKYYKFHYLSANPFIENLAFDNEFDIAKIPSYSYQDIEDSFKVKFVNNIQGNFYNYIIASLDELANIQSDDKYLLIYTKLFETARIESMLPYLNIDSLNKLISYINNHNIKYNSNSALTKVRKLIMKRKEEFNI